MLTTSSSSDLGHTGRSGTAAVDTPALPDFLLEQRDGPICIAAEVVPEERDGWRPFTHLGD